MGGLMSAPKPPAPAPAPAPPPPPPPLESAAPDIEDVQKELPEDKTRSITKARRKGKASTLSTLSSDEGKSTILGG